MPFHNNDVNISFVIHGSTLSSCLYGWVGILNLLGCLNFWDHFEFTTRAKDSSANLPGCLKPRYSNFRGLGKVKKPYFFQNYHIQNVTKIY